MHREREKSNSCLLRPSISSDSPFNTAFVGHRSWEMGTAWDTELGAFVASTSAKSTSPSGEQGMFTWRHLRKRLLPRAARPSKARHHHKVPHLYLCRQKVAFSVAFIQCLLLEALCCCPCRVFPRFTQSASDKMPNSRRVAADSLKIHLANIAVKCQGKTQRVKTRRHKIGI